jgi:hypothetical protein
MEADKGQGGEDAADEGCSRFDGGSSDKNGGRKRNHLSHTSSPGEMPNQQSKNRLAYNYRSLTSTTSAHNCKGKPACNLTLLARSMIVLFILSDTPFSCGVHGTVFSLRITWYEQ